MGRVTGSSQTLTDASCERHSVGQRPKIAIGQSNTCNEYFLFNILTSRFISARITLGALVVASIGHRTALHSYCEIVTVESRGQDLLTSWLISGTTAAPVRTPSANSLPRQLAGNRLLRAAERQELGSLLRFGSHRAVDPAGNCAQLWSQSNQRLKTAAGFPPPFPEDRSVEAG